MIPHSYISRRVSAVLPILVISMALYGSVGASEPRELILLDTTGTPLLDPIEMTGTVKVRTDGSIEVTSDQPLRCDDGCDTVQVGDLSFSASRTTVEVGEDIVLSWNSRGAWDCKAGGTLPDWNTRADLPPSSAQALASQRRVDTAGLEPGSYSVTLLCENGPASSDEGLPRSLTINLDEPPELEADLPEYCSDANRRAPSDWLRMNTGSQSCHWSSTSWLGNSDCREWSEVFGAPFDPEGTGTTVYLGPRISSGLSYIALRFNSGDVAPTDRGRFIVNTAPGMQSTRKLMTVSRCPGDFNEKAIFDRDTGGTGCMISTVLDALQWGGPEDTRTCKLEPNTQYFLNIVYTDDRPDGDLTWSGISPHPTCVDDARCGNLFRNTN